GRAGRLDRPVERTPRRAGALPLRARRRAPRRSERIRVRDARPRARSRRRGERPYDQRRAADRPCRRSVRPAASAADRAPPTDAGYGVTGGGRDGGPSMIARRTCLVAVLMAGCTVATPPPPATVHSVAVLPPSNRTGDSLLVSGTSLLEQYAFHTDRATVPDVLAPQLRMQLRRRGIAGVSPEVAHAGT